MVIRSLLVEKVQFTSKFIMILPWLHKAKQVDFSVYKKATIGRRIERRMVALKVTTLNEYVKLITTKPQEVELLYKDILIGVTSFFRDQAAYESLENNLDSYLDNVSDAKELRVWMPGSSTGEEAYSVAIILNELLDQRQQSLDLRIFATDIDEDALRIARKGVYSQASMTEELQSTNEDLQTAYAELKAMYHENSTIKENYGVLNRRYESMLENINDGIVITNMDGIILNNEYSNTKLFTTISRTITD